ncbi:MAG: N-acetyltransferase, partial [Candidatus Dormibacteria bacterium]
ALIGAGTVVVRGVPPHALVVGCPGRQIGWVCVCGQSLDGRLACPGCGRGYLEASGGVEVRPRDPDT